MLGRDYPVNLNYAYGTRNSIGVSVDRSASDSLVVDTLKKYTDRKHLIEIEEDWVSLTKKGVVECQKSSREWD